LHQEAKELSDDVEVEELDVTCGHLEVALAEYAHLFETEEELVETLNLSMKGVLFSAAASSDKTFYQMQAVSEGSIDFYQQFSLEEWEKKTISKIITTMAENNIFRLGLKKKELEKKGREINHVHPMWFIAFIVSDSNLKRCMHQIRKSGFKWDGFIDGFSRRMNEESARNNLVPHIQGFASLLNRTPEEVRFYIDNHDWEGLVRNLIR
jgi:hypothetical protein